MPWVVGAARGEILELHDSLGKKYVKMCLGLGAVLGREGS